MHLGSVATKDFMKICLCHAQQNGREPNSPSNRKIERILCQTEIWTPTSTQDID